MARCCGYDDDLAGPCQSRLGYKQGMTQGACTPVYCSRSPHNQSWKWMRLTLFLYSLLVSAYQAGLKGRFIPLCVPVTDVELRLPEEVGSVGPGE